jgi:hypothetical protein
MNLGTANGQFHLYFLIKFCMIFASPLSDAFLCPPHPLWSDVPNNIKIPSENSEADHYGIFSIFCYFLPLKCKYTPQQYIFKHPH